MDSIVIALVALVAGGIAGSVINMFASRLPAEGDPPAVGPPIRPGTDQPDPTAWVPYFGARIPAGGTDWHKLATELAAAGIIAASLALHGSSYRSAMAVLFSLLLLLILRIDWQHHLIFSVIVVPGIVLALAMQAADSLDALVSAAIAAVIAAIVFLVLYLLALLLYGKRALGFGDVLLAGLIGAMTGLSEVGGALLLGMVLGAFGGLFLILIRVRSRTDYIPYGAYLCVGAIWVVIT